MLPEQETVASTSSACEWLSPATCGAFGADTALG